MKIVKLELINFRGIEEAEIEFDGNCAVIYGINGMGKSTILEACNLLFSRVFKALTASNLGRDRDYQIKESDIKAGEVSTRVKMEVDLGGRIYTYHRSAQRSGKRTHAGKFVEKIAEAMQDMYLGKYEVMVEDEESDESEREEKRIFVLNDQNMPIYATYGVNRYVTDQIDKIVKDEDLPGKLEAWRDIFDPTINFKLFFEWFRGRQEIENSRKVEDDSFKDAQLSAVRQAVLKILDNDFSDIKIRLSDEGAQMIAVKHDIELSIAQLSEGEKCVLAMTGDLARKLAIANPRRKNPLRGEGIVLIDEVDLHLHPTWQGRILPLLINTFPNIQFIVTTHSPKILGEITDEADIFEIYEEQGNIEVRKQPSMSGWDLNHIMKEFMHTNVLNKKTESLLDLMYEHIDNDEFDEAEKLADKLAQMTDEMNLNVVRARTLIHRNR